MSWLVEVAKLLFVSSCLGYASVSDVRTRMVSDAVWLVMAAGALPITLYEVYTGSLPHLLFVASAGLCFLIGLAAHWVGLFGGADMIALWAIGLAIPAYPSWSSPALGMLHPLLSLATFNNTLALAAATALYALVRNLAYRARGRALFEGLEGSLLSKVVALFTGFKVEASKLGPRSHVFLMEEVSGGRRRLKTAHLVRACRGESMGAGEAARVFQGDVWVAPALPLVAYMLAGLVLSLTVGDLLVFIAVRVILPTIL